MNVKAEKNKLIDWITSLNDSSMIRRLISIKEEVDKDWWDALSERERKGIQQGQEDIRNGKVYSHEEVMSEYKSRFKV